MVELLENCDTFLDFGIKNDIYVPKKIFDKFYESINSLFVYAKLKGYTVNYRFVYPSLHSFHFISNNNKSYTLQIKNNVDDYRVLFNMVLFYHFVYDYQEQLKCKTKFEKFYKDYVKDDNFVCFDSEEELINGLEKFQKII